jgi:serine phosphatase RsbU (regulator of sigma subunit)
MAGDVSGHSVSGRLPRSRGVGRVLFMAVLVAVVALDVLAGWAGVSRYRAERDAAVDDLRSEAAQRGLFVEEVVVFALEQLETLAAEDEVRSGDPSRVQAFLTTLDASTAGFTGEIAWVDTAGDLRAISGAESGSIQIPFDDRDWVAAGLRGQRFVGKAIVSRVFDRPVIPITVPTRDADGAVNGVLSGGVLLERTGRLLGVLAAGPNVLVVDRAGQVIVGDRPQVDALAPPAADWPSTRYVEPGVAVGVTDPIGLPDRVVAWAPVSSAGWAVVTTEPTSEVFGSATRELVVGAAVIGVATATVLCGAWLLGRRLERRYRELQAVAARAEADHVRSTAMSAAMAQLAAAETMGQVAEVVATGGLAWFGSRAAGMSILDEDEPMLLVNLASEGWSEEHRRGWRRFRIDTALPVGDAIVNAHPVFVTASELPERYPAAAEVMLATGDAAWAALPLMDGTTPLGTFSASFTSEAALDRETQLRLGLFAERVSNAMARVRRHEADHDLAAAFQRAVIPEHMPAISGVHVEGVYLPASSAVGVGGDWYDTIRLSDHELMVVCGDIVGHGLAAATAASRLRVATATLAAAHRPAALLEALDQFAASDSDAQCSSMICLVIDSARRTIEYSAAGHPHPILMRASAPPEELLEGRGRLLGITNATRATGWATWDEDCRSILLYTDGLIERRGEHYDTGVHRLLSACAAMRIKPTTARQLADTLIPDTRIDDVTAVLIHFDAEHLVHNPTEIAQWLPGMEPHRTPNGTVPVRKEKVRRESEPIAEPNIDGDTEIRR